MRYLCTVGMSQHRSPLAACARRRRRCSARTDTRGAWGRQVHIGSRSAPTSYACAVWRCGGGYGESRGMVPRWPCQGHLSAACQRSIRRVVIAGISYGCVCWTYSLNRSGILRGLGTTHSPQYGHLVPASSCRPSSLRTATRYVRADLKFLFRLRASCGVPRPADNIAWRR